MTQRNLYQAEDSYERLNKISKYQAMISREVEQEELLETRDKITKRSQRIMKLSQDCQEGESITKIAIETS